MPIWRDWRRRCHRRNLPPSERGQRFRWRERATPFLFPAYVLSREAGASQEPDWRAGSSSTGRGLDGPAGFRLSGDGVAGLTPWSLGASLRSQVRAGSALHAGNGAGSLALFVGDEGSALAPTLEAMWRRTEVVRVELMYTRRGQGRHIR